MTEPRPRLVSVDWLRGVVMVLMALDHARDYFGDLRIDPTGSGTTPALFFTRWITHLCAPTFVFLAGTGAWLYAARGRSRGELSRFLWTRGLWLLVLEFTVIQFAWTMSLGLGLFMVQVITAIGVAMIALAVLVHLPLRAVVGIGMAITLGHNLLDPVQANGSLWWLLVHESGMVRPFDGGPVVWVIYPLLPWIGVMALGYAFGALLTLEQHRRRRLFLGLGAGLTLAFCVLRAVGGYGNPTPFVPQDTIVMSVVSFLNCQKYPPSLAYLLMTLGLAIALLGLLDREPGRIGRVFVVFGRVPLLYYVVHLYVIHLASRVFYLLRYGEGLSLADVFRSFQGSRPLPDWYGHSLWLVYIAWILCVAALYPLCAWFAEVKRRSSARWLSYL